MFSIFKKAANENVVLQDLSDGQLTQVAGGSDCDHDADDMMQWKPKHHHKHHHHHKHQHQSYNSWQSSCMPSSMSDN